MPHISLAAETITTVFGIPITNSLVTTYLVMAILFVLALRVSRNITQIPNNFQLVFEIVIGGLYDFFKSVTGKHIRHFFPLLASIFIFVVVSNWIGLLPGVGTIGFHHEERNTEARASVVYATEATETVPVGVDVETTAEGVASEPESEASHAEPSFTPLFRAPTADLNTTLALALIAVFAIQYFGFALSGLHYSSRFLNFENPILFAVGILELASEISKIISFAFRLFGNIFAGEVLLTVIAFLIPVIVPLPFLTLELFVGFIQALVFSMLTAVFLNVAVSHGEEHGGHHEATDTIVNRRGVRAHG